MTIKLSGKVLANHLSEQKHNLNMIKYVFENVDVLKKKQHIDNPQMLSLMLEFIGPFKKMGVADLEKTGNANLVKNLQKNMKSAVGDATKAASRLKSVDLTSVQDVKAKVGDLVKAVVTVGAIEKDLMDGTHGDVKALDIITPDLEKAIDAVYALSAHNLNAVKSLIDSQVATLEKAIDKSWLDYAVKQHGKSLADKDAEAQRKADLKGITTPLHKHLAGMLGGASHASGMGMPGGMKLREDGEEELEVKNRFTLDPDDDNHSDDFGGDLDSDEDDSSFGKRSMHDEPDADDEEDPGMSLFDRPRRR